MKITPLFDNVLLEPLKAQEQTTSGIYLPDDKKEKPLMGIIQAVGEGKIDKNGNKIEMVVKAGQKVYYKQWADHPLKLEGKEYILISQEDILAIII